MDTSTPQQASFFQEVKSPIKLLEVGLLHERFKPATILEPRTDAPKGRIWCKHCELFLVIGAESVSHQNLVRESQVCMTCGAWNWLDEAIPVVHERLCEKPRVVNSWGGSQSRATVRPPTNASQEEAAAWPHV